MNRVSNSFEKLPVQIFSSAAEGSLYIARRIANLIKERDQEGKKTVLGLATGSSPTRVYDELIRLHKEENLSFKNVITFNLDEYYPIAPDALQSYVRFMHEVLFDHIDIPASQIHIPDGTLQKEQVAEYCTRYEEQIREAGGIDVQILGIGRTGHIGFNEPGSTAQSITRLVTLDKVTIRDAAPAFFGIDNVPKRAITMGVSTILSAKKIFLMAWGEGKAPVVQQLVEGDPDAQVPATFLQRHGDCQVILDEPASAELARTRTPWLTGPVNWNPYLIKKAVVWLSLILHKPILRLTEEDYAEHGMSDILLDIESAYNVNIRIFNELQHTITGWPGGKPNADDTFRPERKSPFPKRALIFSPHPDDDVISMGGTFSRLTEHGHEVHVAYQTSGNVGVYDDDALQYADFVTDYHEMFHLEESKVEDIFQDVKKFLSTKQPGQKDSEELKLIKGLIRKGEAKSACRYIGIPDEQIHFQNLPFYETGMVRKSPLSEVDIEITKELLRSIKPHQIYAAGDLSDPHGTHRVCLEAVLRAMEELKDESWTKDCYIWLYRGAWQEWNIEDIEMAVPLSPDETERKKRAIFKHKSQKDRPLIQGDDNREFWQRVEERNRSTAEMYNKLGLAEYEALEAFVRWKGF